MEIQNYISDPNYTLTFALSSNNAKTLEAYRFTIFMFFTNKQTGYQDKAFSLSNKFDTPVIFREELSSDLLKFNEGWEKYKLKKIINS